ncbi:MAG: helix-turn-helix domain-containing protein [Thermoprotei archaeon]
MVLPDANSVDVICADSPKDVQRLKLIAEELDNDTGREVYLAFYSGLETVSQVAEKLGTTIQLVSYHVEKLLLAGLIREKRETGWVSIKGRSVKHYEPARTALLIIPSLRYLKTNGERAAETKDSIADTIKRFLPEVLAPAGAFLAAFYLPRLGSTARTIAAYMAGLVKTVSHIASNAHTTTATTHPNQSLLAVAPQNTSAINSLSSELSSMAASLSSSENLQVVGIGHSGFEMLMFGLLVALLVWLGVHLARRRR